MKNIVLLFSVLLIAMVEAESPIEISFPDNSNFELVTDETTPYSVNPRKDYSVKKKSCGAVLISENWAMTANHCIKSKYTKKPYHVVLGLVKGTTTYKNKKKYTYTWVHAKKIVRHKYLDVALIQLNEHSSNVEPILLLNEPIKKKDKMFKMAKVYRQVKWKNIPVHASKKGKLFVRKKIERENLVQVGRHG